MKITTIIFVSIFSFPQNSDEGATNCAQYNGKDSQCKANKCNWCPCTGDCVRTPVGCERGCKSFCGRQKDCAEHGCIYNYRRKECYDYSLDTGVDFIDICSGSKCMKKECASIGCAFCAINRTCVPPALSRGCNPGCRTFCDNVDECAAAGCIYSYDTGDCLPNNSSLTKRYGGNICGNATTTPAGHWYQAIDNSTFTVLSTHTWTNCRCVESFVSSHPEKELYRCNYQVADVLIPIPLRDAGSFILGLHLIENYKPTNRTESIFVNELVVNPAFELDSIGPAGTPHEEKVMIDINCALTELTVKGRKAPIVNRELILHLKVVPRYPGDTIHAVLSAYYFEKVDA